MYLKKKAKGPKIEKAIIDKSKMTSLVSRFNQSAAAPLLTTSIKASITATKTQIEKAKLIIDNARKVALFILELCKISSFITLLHK